MRTLFALLVFMMLAAMPAAAETKTPDLVEVLELQGEISQGTVEMLARQVEVLSEHPRIKAVVLVVNSPGGGAVASAALYDAISKIKVPVVGWCSYVCASGGYYVLMAPSVKHIGIRPETITGSIGVIMQVTRFSRLLDWAKIDNETYVSGSLKDAGNPTRAGREDERKYLQSILTELADRFYDIVAKRRSIRDWPALKTGRIFIGESAVRAGLVDSIMSREEAIKKAKELSGSKLIFTRDEIRKMSKAAEADPVGYRAPLAAPQGPLGDVPWVIELLKEIRAGESVRFSYQMPYSF